MRARASVIVPQLGRRIGILDPNVTVMKTSHLPMLVCEAAYRRSPGSFKAIYVTNGWPHRDNAHFRSFTASLTAARDGVMTLEPRFVGLEFLADHCDAVVTHHWENGLNYLYYEVLYGNYPLIHNSAFLKDHGYYYPDFEAEAGAEALLTALAEHPKRQAEHAARARSLFAALDPAAAANIRLHEGLLAEASAPE